MPRVMLSPVPNQKAFGEKLWNFRHKSKGKTILQQQAAREAGISAAIINKVEKEGTYSVETYIRLSLWMGEDNTQEIIEHLRDELLKQVTVHKTIDVKNYKTRGKHVRRRNQT